MAILLKQTGCSKPATVTGNFCLVVFFVFQAIGTSCTNKLVNTDANRFRDSANIQTQSTAAQVKGMTANAPFDRTKLLILYLENTRANSQLHQLLGSKNKHKVTFQTYLDATGNIGLYAYPGKKVEGVFTEGKFFIEDRLRLNQTTEEGEVLNNREVIFGDMELDEKNAKEVKKIVVAPDGEDNAAYRYIYFVPVIKTEPLTGLNYLYYDIRVPSDNRSVLTTKETTPIKALLIRSIAIANPSPPATAY